MESIFFNKNNPCGGKYDNCIDIKITNKCNGNCKFCIEKGGYSPKDINIDKIIDTIKKLTYCENILILGGEPLLSPILFDFLEGISDLNKTIYLTTNGSLLNTEIATKLSKYISYLNISIHHYNLDINEEITGVKINISDLIQAINILNQNGVKVRINTLLCKGYLDNFEDIKLMSMFAKYLNVYDFRLSEIQDDKDNFIDAINIFKNIEITKNPFKDGCEIELSDYMPLKTTLRLTCEYVNPCKLKINNDIFEEDYLIKTKEIADNTKVIYQNGESFKKWIKEDEKKTNKEYNTPTCHRVGCH
jgi:molybdenum cofactor biosynthesis enzyme MoaA